MSLHLGHAPQLAVPFLYGRIDAVYLLTEIIIEVNGETTLTLIGQLFFFDTVKNDIFVF